MQDLSPNKDNKKLEQQESKTSPPSSTRGNQQISGALKTPKFFHESQKNIHAAIQEVKSHLVLMNYSQSFFDAILWFSIPFFSINLLLKLNFLYTITISIIISLLAFFFTVLKNNKKMQLAFAESKTPELEWKLRTAADNLEEKNELIKQLHEQVLKELHQFKTTSLFELNKVSSKIVLISIICFLGVFLTFLNPWSYKPFDTGGLVGVFDNFLTSISDKVNIKTKGFQNDSDIYGDPALAQLGDKELQLLVNPLQNEINLDEIKPAQENEFGNSDLPDEISASNQASFEDEIPSEHQEVVKKYFKEIASTK